MKVHRCPFNKKRASLVYIERRYKPREKATTTWFSWIIKRTTKCLRTPGSVDPLIAFREKEREDANVLLFSLKNMLASGFRLPIPRRSNILSFLSYYEEEKERERNWKNSPPFLLLQLFFRKIKWKYRFSFDADADLKIQLLVSLLVELYAKKWVMKFFVAWCLSEKLQYSVFERV